MAVTDATIFIIALLIFDYLVVYSKNRFLGNMLYMLLGLGIMYKAQADAWIGFMILIGGMASFVYDIAGKLHK